MKVTSQVSVCLNVGKGGGHKGIYLKACVDRTSAENPLAL